MAQAYDYSANGIKTAPAFPAAGDMVEITYSGLLAASGAGEVYAHVGYNDGWENVHDWPMTKTAAGFTTALRPPPGAKSVSYCFRDPANNWDNNSGRNYRLDLYDAAALLGVGRAEFATELGGGFAFTYSPGKHGNPHGVRGRTFAAARQITGT